MLNTQVKIFVFFHDQRLGVILG